MPEALVRIGGMSLLCIGVMGCLPRGESAAPAPLCVPGLHAGLVGQPVAAAARLPAPKRIIGPDQMVTMEYNPARTNIETDAAGVITRVFCG